MGGSYKGMGLWVTAIYKGMRLWVTAIKGFEGPGLWCPV